MVPSSGFVVRSRREVILGPVHIDMRSNEERFVGMRYFPHSRPVEGTIQADYALSFCNLNVDGPWSRQEILKEQDESYRAKKFAAGYYITDHYGAPANIVTRGTHYWIFGTDFELILWPYVIKLLLTLYSFERELLHLKAASIAWNGAGTLLVGRGGSGKTVLMTQLCRQGAQFFSNTHSLIQEHHILPVPTAMRVRNDSLFAPIIAERKLPMGIKRDEYLADPLTDLGWLGGTTARLKNIFLLDYRGPDTRDIREMDREVLLNYMEQFSLPLNVYGIKEDILDHLGGDVAAFSLQMNRMREQLHTLVERCNGYYVSCDATDPGNLREIQELL